MCCLRRAWRGFTRMGQAGADILSDSGGMNERALGFTCGWGIAEAYEIGEVWDLSM